MRRPTAEKRHLDYVKAIRKRRIDREISNSAEWSHDWYNNLHQYSKNKIHCSCPICSCKTNNKHRHNAYLPSTNWSISDRRKLDELEYQEDNDLTFDEN